MLGTSVNRTLSQKYKHGMPEDEVFDEQKAE